MKKVRIQMKKKKSCLPKKLPVEKKSIFSKYVTEYILTNPININVNTSKHETRSKFLILLINIKITFQIGLKIFC